MRLFVESKKSFGGIHPLLSEGLGEAVCLHFDYAFCIPANSLYDDKRYSVCLKNLVISSLIHRKVVSLHISM